MTYYTISHVTFISLENLAIYIHIVLFVILSRIAMQSSHKLLNLP